MHTNPIENKGFIQIIMGSAIWGSIGVFVMLLDQNGSNASLTSLLRVTFAFLIMACLTIYRYGFSAFSINKKDLAACALLGLLCHGIYNIFYNLTIINSGVAISAVMLNTSPVFTAITAHIVFSEHFSKTKLAALFINIGGCILAVTGGQFNLGVSASVGLIFGLAASFLYSLTPIIGRIAGSHCNSFVMSTYSYLFAALSLTIYDPPANNIGLITIPILALAFLYALIPTSIAYLLYYQGIQKIKETSKVPVIASVETLTAIGFGLVLFHEQLGFINIIGIILVLSSIALMNLQRKQKRYGAVSASQYQ